MRIDSLSVLRMIFLNEMGFSFRFLLETDFLQRRWLTSTMLIRQFDDGQCTNKLNFMNSHKVRKPVIGTSQI